MPNHCLNLITITGPLNEMKRLQTLVCSPNNPFDFEQILPCPAALRERIAPFRAEDGESEQDASCLQQRLLQQYGADTWYTWCIEHWGTKWNSYRHQDEPGYDYRFETAWGPPYRIFEELSRRFPVEITALDYDEGGAFCTRNVYRNGQCVAAEDLSVTEEAEIAALF